LTFIRHCRSLDMTLDEIRALLKFREAPEKNCGEVNALLDEHIEHVADRITELKTLHQQLSELRRLCDEVSEVKDCGILSGLASGAPVVARQGQCPVGQSSRSRSHSKTKSD
jgi:DNA-binding transcriptional MerR regulator